MQNSDINLYEIFLQYSYSDMQKLFKESKTKEERDFYVVLSDLILQREQKKIIEK